MLEVLLGDGVRNVAVVVTRYFGGVLLGTGGLVRAYTQAVQAGLAASTIGEMCQGHEILLKTDYNGVGKVLYILGQHGIEAFESDYGVDVSLKIRVRTQDAPGLKKEMIEATSGKIQWEKLEDIYFIYKK